MPGPPQPTTPRAGAAEPERTGDGGLDEDLIAERLRWTPKQRLEYLLDMLEFEGRARRARPVDGRGR